jgi:HEAT repeat protein
VAALVLALRDETAAVRRGAAEALGNLGAEATAAIPSLQQAIQDRDEGVRKRAALAREKIDLQIKAAILRAA